ncbi:acetyl-CoA acetyltransferase [Desulfitobacterium dichloroeliminans LMG P-21439]|uniref:acetyl-CoA C-acetyltransferase n=1 Tax=Desulfitobacterium dichloroeliminans (strain LMG P-21439 / DCA1) TaxID=871963 RepID=L0FAT5_DESDL|nr:thiolase family protein [Desulfitobacterium dichloroeliminans]AGA70125.1 acetyl-CoA acetyltransferase [Desulfitobacterium dichloroeliminans LMG P-21439]
MSFRKSEDDIVCISATRTPFGKFGGSLKDIDIYELGAIAMRNAMAKIDLDPALIDEVWWGNGDTSSTKDPFTPVVARQTMLKAGIPPETPSVAFDQACTSALSTIKYGARSIKLGEAKIVMTGGATSFSTIPFLLRDIRWEGKKHSSFMVEDPIIPLGYKDYAPVAVDSGNVAIEYGVLREEQDELALASHLKYGQARERGFFNNELQPLEIMQKDRKGKTLTSKLLDIDEQFRPNITIESLAKLKPIFDNPTCTAGNAPGMNDGATAQIITTRKNAEQLGLPILYTLVSISAIALQPRIMPVSPAFAIKKCLDEAELTMADIQTIEINEAFACVPLVSLKLLANERFLNSDYQVMVKEASTQPILDYDPASYQKLKEKLNPNGSAIAVGHPNTASGARIMMTAAYHLKETGGGYAACAICGGLTQGAGAIIWVE